MNSVEDSRQLISLKMISLAMTSGGKNITMRLARSAGLRRLTLGAQSEDRLGKEELEKV